MTFKETEKQYRKAMEQLKSRIAGDWSSLLRGV
jgi:hypothetical protein